MSVPLEQQAIPPIGMIDSIAAHFGWLPRWVAAIIVFVLILVAAYAVQGAAAWALGRRSGGWNPTLQRVFQETRRIARFAVIMLAAAIAIPLVPMPAQANDTIRKVFAAAFVTLIGWIVAAALNIAIDRYIGRFNLHSADNLLARKAVTQARVFKRALNLLVFVLTAAFALMTFDSVRQYGVSLFASAGVAGIVVGLAAQPLLGNLLAGMQLAMTQPIRLDDALFIENEFGYVEEITSAYVVVRLWDWRRLIVPLTYFFQKPFQNWTRSGSALLGNAKIYLDYSAPVDRLRKKLEEIVKAAKQWDGNIVKLQVTAASERTIELRALFSGRDSGAVSDLGSIIREELIAFAQRECPECLPRDRNETLAAPRASGDPSRLQNVARPVA